MKCHKDGCHSGADYHVGLELQCVGVDAHRQTLQAPTTLKVCVKHMHDAAAYILSPANRAQIVVGLTNEGMPMPDFSSAEVVFVPISAKAEDFNAAHEAGTRH